MSDARLLDTLMASEPGWMTITSEAEFARERKAKFAPTLMFMGAAGAKLAPPIVGLSRDFFSAYLDQRVQMASKAVE